MHFPDTFEAWLIQRFGRDPLPEGTESVLCDSPKRNS
jgi:hypothetical protein